MDSNYTRFGYVAETTIGTTPSANLKLLRRTGGAGVPKRATQQSQEIQSSLRPGKPVRVGEWHEGSVNIEWSADTMDDLLEGMLMSAWTSSILVDGTTQKHYTFEDSYIDPSVSPFQYMIYKGSRLQRIDMKLVRGSIVTGSIGWLGMTPSIAQASVGTGYTAATITEPFNTVNMVTTLTEASAALGKVAEVNLSLTRNLRQQGEIGSLNPFDIGVGRLMVSGSIKQYFRDDTLMDAWFAFSERAMRVKLDDAAGGGGGNTIQFDIAKMKYVGDPVIEVPGPDSDVYVTVNFEAYADPVDPYLIKFTRG